MSEPIRLGVPTVAFAAAIVGAAGRGTSPPAAASTPDALVDSTVVP